jgi:hypothetical protein
MLLSRQYLLAHQRRLVQNYALIYNACRSRNSLLETEIEQLSQDCQNGNLPIEHFATWKVSLSCHWLGRVQALPDYYALLCASGFKPGQRIPGQFIHPQESRQVFDMVAAWMERIKLEQQLQALGYPLPSQATSPSLNSVEWTEQVKQESEQDDYHINFADRLSLNRNWVNQFML